MSYPIPDPIPAPTIVEAFDELVERVKRLLEEARRGVQCVLDGAERVAFLAVGAVRARIHALSEQIKDLLRRVLDLVVEYFEPFGAPRKVWQTGAAWSQQFAGPLSADVAQMNFEDLAVDYHWDGRAAEAYAHATEKQRTALTGLQAVGADLQSGLGNIAVAICALWATAAAAVFTFLGSLAAAAVGLVTLVGAAAALATVAAGLGALLLGLTAGITGFMLVAERVNDGMATLRARLDDESAFGDELWPRSATDRYGDGADWKLAE